MQKKISALIRFPLYFAAFVLLGLVFGYLTFKILSFSKTVDVPALSNLTLVEANEALSKAGLYLKIEGEDYDAAVQAGRILRQDIPAGKKVKEKRAIKVVISKGPRVSSIPDLTGKTVPEAENILSENGLRIGRTINIHSESAEKGKIAAQRPEPGERLSGLITVLVSVGPHEVTYTSPDFAGSSLEDARKTAEKMGLVVEAQGAGGKVTSQKPKPGAVIRSGDKIQLELKEAN